MDADGMKANMLPDDMDGVSIARSKPGGKVGARQDEYERVALYEICDHNGRIARIQSVPVKTVQNLFQPKQ
jgi:hypothetical protein